MQKSSRLKRSVFTEVESLYQTLTTTSQGLTVEQVSKNKETYGSNCLVGSKRDGTGYRLRRAFINPFTSILFVLAGVSFIVDICLVGNRGRNATSVLIILGMIMISGSIRFIQELKSKEAAESLERLIHTKITVRREGVLIEIPAEELVVGDYVLLYAGDRVPADMRLVSTTDLFISQAALTGESAVMEKCSNAYAYGEQLVLTAYQNLAFMGTTVISGQGEGVVLEVGKHTLYGSFAPEDRRKDALFERGANDIARVMIHFMAILVPVVFLIAGVTQGDWISALLFALSVAVGLTPEMLPMVVTTCLAKGSIWMSRRQTIIRNINAMQGFGSMDVLCMDKTGTLTNETSLLEYYMDVVGNESQDVLDIAYINSFYHTGVNNLMDQAILQCDTMPDKKDYFGQLRARTKKLDEIPFDYNRKYVSMLVASESDRHQLLVKGSIQEVVACCSHIKHGNQILPMPQDSGQSVGLVVDEMLEEGMKVIAVAIKEMGTCTVITPEAEKDMTLVGYIAFFDAPKKSAKASVEALQQLHVKPKVLTGDHPSIATSICQRVGVDATEVMSGEAINQLDDAALRTCVEKVDVFAGLTPDQKVRIVHALRDNGHTVGFLGDGINDIPAIYAADVGISVDTAIDAAKDVADVMLLSKDLVVLEQGILEGRRTFQNMSKYIKITASSNLGNMLSIVLASAVLPFMPMSVIQLLLLNLLYDILCIVLPWDSVDLEDCEVPGEWSGRSLGGFMLTFGGISSLFDIITFVFLYFVVCPSMCGGMLFTQLTTPELRMQYILIFQTGWFLESMWTQVLILHMLRTKKLPFVQSSASKPVWLVTLLGIFVFTTFTFSGIGSLLGFVELPGIYFIFLLLVVGAYMLLTSLVKHFYVKQHHRLL